MREPIGIIFNDIHLKPGNEREVIESVDHMVKYAVENKIENLIFAGDMFESRSFQRLSVLLALERCLNMISEAGLTLYIFPGNHDKTDYKSFDSFLEVYKHYPNVHFNSKVVDIVLKGVQITLLPFFDDEMLVPMINEHPGGDILVSHFEMQGSANLGNVSEKVTITKKLLSEKWNKVYLGHYHNTHEITKDIVHLPSLRQNNFGEDTNKGFSVIYDDGGYEIVPGVFQKYQKVQVDINKVNTEGLKKLIRQHDSTDSIVRFELFGSKADLDALDKGIFEGSGIDVKKKYEQLEITTLKEKPELIKKFDKKQVLDQFKEFCLEKGYGDDFGLKYLKKFLKEKHG